VADNVARVNSIGYTNGGVTVIVPRRNNGPVVSITGNTGISIQYAGWGPTMELEAFRRVNRAANLDEFRAALNWFDVGSQNFAYADKDGNIAYFTTAEAPIRQDLQQNTVNGAPPFLIRNGQGGNEWLPRQNSYPAQSLPYEILSPAEMPFVINPASGYIANANNDPVGTTLDNNPLNQLRPGGGLYYLAPGYSAYRMGRIDRLIQDKIDSGEPITRADMARWQANNSQLDAELVLPYVLNAHVNGTGADWAPLADLAAAVSDAAAALGTWSAPCGSFDAFATPTGIVGGWDPGDVPFSPAPPSDCEIDMSVGATVWALTRSYLIRNTVDATLSRIGLGNALPGSNEAYHALKHHLDSFGTRQGFGASGIDFFLVEGAPSRTAARDFVLLKSVKDALDRLASDEFAPAFANSTNVRDYRWGKLHRKVFAHPLGADTPFSIPGPNAFPFTDVGPGLRGLARAGGYDVLDASGHNARSNTLNGFMFGGGPVRRFVGEMTDPPTLLQIAPGGQSGVITTGAAYISQLPLWLVNGYKPLVIDPAQAAAGAVATIPFVPR
jgi:penicillin G amidase